MKIKLTERMQDIADMVIPGETVADVGTDHGYIPAFLLENEICPSAILTDVAEGPLSKAKSNLKGIDNAYFRLGNGFEILNKAEVSTVIIAGMGGDLIESILAEDPEKSRSFKRIILQPRTKSDQLRMRLKDLGFNICDYSLAEENGRICEVFAIEPSDNPREEAPLISEFLINKGSKYLDRFKEYKINQRKIIIESIQNAHTDVQAKYDQFNNELLHLLKE